TSASPTSVKLGNPLARCTSTVTAAASSPSRARLCTRARLMRAAPQLGARAPRRGRRHGTATVQAGHSYSYLNAAWLAWVHRSEQARHGRCWHGPCLKWLFVNFFLDTV